MSKYPHINISIVPSITVPYVSIRAEWKDKDDVPHGEQVVLHDDEFQVRFTRVVNELVSRILLEGDDAVQEN